MAFGKRNHRITISTCLCRKPLLMEHFPLGLQEEELVADGTHFRLLVHFGRLPCFT